MKKRFIVCISDFTKDKDVKFIEFIRNNRLGWWHWLPNTWLLSDPNGKLSVKQIRDQVRQIYDNEHVLVIEINNVGDTWSGFGPSSEQKNMFKWIKNNWKK